MGLESPPKLTQNLNLTSNTNERSMKKSFNPILKSLIVNLPILLFLSFGSLGCENEEDSIDNLLVGNWKLMMTAYGNESKADTTIVSDNVMVEVHANGTYTTIINGNVEVKSCRMADNLIFTNDNTSYKYHFTDEGNCLVLRYYNPDLIDVTGFFRSLIFERTERVRNE